MKKEGQKSLSYENRRGKRGRKKRRRGGEERLKGKRRGSKM